MIGGVSVDTTNLKRIRGRPKQDLLVRFFKYVRLPFDGSTSCWEWIGTRRKTGYGTILDNGKIRGAHRVAWEVSNGKPVPEGLHVLHTCDHPWCVNPYHLYAGTHAENMRDRLERKRNPQARKTHCKFGHPFSGENLVLRDGARRCRQCIRRWGRLNHAKKQLKKGNHYELQP